MTAIRYLLDIDPVTGKALLIVTPDFARGIVALAGIPALEGERITEAMNRIAALEEGQNVASCSLDEHLERIAALEAWQTAKRADAKMPKPINGGADATREVTMKKAIIIDPKPCDRIDWSGTTYRIEIETEPGCDELDFPIRLTLANGDAPEPSLEFEPDDAEAVGRALIRAAEIRRSVLAKEVP